MWFSETDFDFSKSLKKEDIYGYVLPHAGTAHTGKIYIHTLQYIPRNMDFSNVYIFYYPANDSENVEENGKKYYHEYYVPMKSLKYIFKHWWKIPNKKFTGINVKSFSKNMRKFDTHNNLLIISADFSHYLHMQQAISIENKSAISLLFKTHHISQKHVDHMAQFMYVFERLDEDFILKWIGRTRSSGSKGVGYLSFLITKQHKPKNPDGYLITVYDEDMNSRECLGYWGKYSKTHEKNFIEEVKHKGENTSRLTNGLNKNIPIKYYKITYLYKDNSEFSRGYHGVKTNAFFLPEVFLENTYENGKWINHQHSQWDHSNKEKFDMGETISKLNNKAGSFTNVLPQLFKARSFHGIFR